MRPELIFCGGNNPTWAQLAQTAGFRYGVRLPGTVYGAVFFADQHYHQPNRAAYMAALGHERPRMATVLDWERLDQRAEVLDWAAEAAAVVDEVVIIPKVAGAIAACPRTIGGARVVLGYSVPTTYGGTCLPLWAFAGWPVHLLGGSPQSQLGLWRTLSCCSEVVSVDGNMHLKMATSRCLAWAWPGRWLPLGGFPGSGPEEAFRRSCAAIQSAWTRVCKP